jgi:hypothetical protein
MIDLAQIEAALTIGKWIKKRFTVNKVNPLVSRFISLFEKHGVHRNEIPHFFGHGLTLADIASNKKLLVKLTFEIQQSACKLFAVRLKWLQCVDDRMYEIHDFNQPSEEYAEFLAQLIAASEHRIIAKLVLSTHSSQGEDALLILEEPVGYIDDKPVIRYHLCGNWNSKYWKSRADLAACIAMTLKQSVFMKGRLTPSKIGTFCAGKGFIEDLYNLPFTVEPDGLFKRRLQYWHPDSWIYDPAAFLEGVGEGDFGKANALARWLYYFDQGYMETEYPRENARTEFAELLEKYEQAG